MPHVWLEECWKNSIACQGNTAKITSPTNPVHSTQQTRGKPNSSILISGFISRDFLSKTLLVTFSIWHFSLDSKCSLCMSFHVIQNWAHQATFPTERNSRCVCFLKKYISIFRRSLYVNPESLLPLHPFFFWSKDFYWFVFGFCQSWRKVMSFVRAILETSGGADAEESLCWRFLMGRNALVRAFGVNLILSPWL